jgi:putative ABC transport system permease protein
MLWEAVKLALSSIMRNKLRSVLTLLGIVIGVAAVIALVTLGSGASTKVRENLSKLGSNMLIVRPGQSTFGPGGTTDSRAFDERDVAALKANLTGIRGVAPTAQKQAKVVYGALNYDTSVTGTNTDWFTVQDWVIADGRAFTEGEIRAGTSVCVIGDTIRRELFTGEDPIGARTRASATSRSRSPMQQRLRACSAMPRTCCASGGASLLVRKTTLQFAT